MTRLDPALRLVFWATVAELGLSAMAQLFSLFVRGASDWRLWLNVEVALLSAGYFVALICFGLAMVKLTGADSERGTRAFALAAMACFGVLALFMPIDVWQSLTETRLDLVDGAVIRWFRVGVANVATMVLGLAFFRACAQRGVQAPLAVLAGAVGTSLVAVAFSVYSQADGMYVPWHGYLQSGLGALELGLIAVYVHVSRKRLTAHRPSTAAMREAADPAWREAAQGLSTYATAVKARLVFAIIAAPLAAVVGQSSDLGAGVKGVVVFASLVSFATGMIIIAGLVRFARMPAPADGTAASVAVVLIAVGFLFDLWTIALAMQLDASAMDAAIAFVRQAPFAEAGAQVCGAFALLGVLGAIKSAATARGAPELVDRATAVGWLLAGGGLLLAVLKAVATSMRGADLVLVLALPLLIALLVGLVRFFGLLTDAVRLLQPTHEPAAASSSQSDA